MYMYDGTVPCTDCTYACMFMKRNGFVVKHLLTCVNIQKHKQFLSLHCERITEQH